MNTYQLDRLNKIEALSNRGIGAYPVVSDIDISIVQFINCYQSLITGAHDLSIYVTTAGRLMARRGMKKSIYIDLASGGAQIQGLIKVDDLDDEQNFLLSQLDLGDFIQVSGHPFRTQRGELTIYISSIKLLSKGLAVLPEKYHGIENPELCLKHRALAMVNDFELQGRLILRSRVISFIRRQLEKNGFLEFETPILQTTYGGANARPFTSHHHALGREQYMKISPELYLKRLLVGGMERVFEVTKCFRNEGIDRTHQPEFTMIEWYQAYSDYLEQMPFVEELISTIVEQVHGSRQISYQGMELDFSTPWRRLSVEEGVRQYANIESGNASLEEMLLRLRERDPSATMCSRGELTMRLFEEYAEPELWQPTFVIDHPVEVSPLTKSHRQQTHLVERFEPFIAGMEVGNAYSELNDPMEQRRRMEAQQRARYQEGEIPPVDENFLAALELGMPPAAGVGLGIDRLMMILTGSLSIREVIPFPQ